MQFLAKFKKILNMGFRATLNFRKFKVALNPMYTLPIRLLGVDDPCCVRRRRTLPNAVEIDILGIFEGYSSLQIWPPQKIFRGEII